MPALALPAAVAVALPAIVETAEPSVVIPAAAEPDPIFAALAEHRRLYREWSSLCDELDDAERKVKERRPILLITWQNYSIGSSEIERVRDEFLAHPRANRKKIEREYQKAKADLRARHQAERQRYKRHGLAPLQAETNRASKAERQAATALTRIRPTTLAGVCALVSYVRKDLKTGEDYWHSSALANAAKTVQS